MTCPLCNGKGHIPSKQEAKRENVIPLRAKGLTFRQIMKVMRMKSTSNVAYYIKGE